MPECLQRPAPLWCSEPDQSQHYLNVHHGINNTSCWCYKRIRWRCLHWAWWGSCSHGNHRCELQQEEWRRSCLGSWTQLWPCCDIRRYLRWICSGHVKRNFNSLYWDTLDALITHLPYDIGLVIGLKTSYPLAFQRFLHIAVGRSAFVFCTLNAVP
jgi:hypothetical protein